MIKTNTCPHDEFTIRCDVCNGNQICIHGRLFILCMPCMEVKSYKENK